MASCGLRGAFSTLIRRAGRSLQQVFIGRWRYALPVVILAKKWFSVTNHIRL